ncbi:DUF4081 domain-containing GNAT family N-acetyltransferase [Granulicoccus phenolivorans]|uniref:GNAT family N-acetyltransferase n=1 Tax=Granulicoccus phenolivorans TaxID=266854 RepID=UPI0003F86984|nr:DUF4081 domain-containing GNAT family N-acetyltransferase [Granulicoccus phenolivorans]
MVNQHSGADEHSTRMLTDRDLPRVRKLLDTDPIDHVFVAARVEQYGLEPWRLGCPVWGYFVGEDLVSLLHQGANLVPVNADPATALGSAVLDTFVEICTGKRLATSIVGRSATVLELWRRLALRWGQPWAGVREVRAHQPMMAINRDPLVPGDPRVRRIGPELLGPYFRAAVEMYTEEVGVSPISNGDSGPYRAYVRRIIEQGRAFGIVEGGRVLFKSDLGSVCGGVAQVQGVWLDPELRGQGLAAPAVASVVRLARERYPVISLYVNDFNTRAIATYRRVGFAQTGDFATVLY